MNRFSVSRAAIVAALAIPVLAAPAFAQTIAPNTSAPPASPAAAEPTLPKAISGKVEQRIKQLHHELGITSAEQPQWDQFAQVMRDNAAEMNQAFTDRGTKVHAMNASDNMQSYAQLAQVHATNMQKLASAFQSLYSSFPDQQKLVADAVFRKSNALPTRPGK
jgi:Spy/CpxP family protein refolding chaperone